MRNLIIAIKEQGPFKRFIRNFFITGNAWGMFHRNSHVNQRSGKLKVQFSTIESARRATTALYVKTGARFSPYKCVFCDGYHIGRNKN